MIELVSEAKCITCDLCVDACPDDVFDRVDGGAPIIARQANCQTCYLCELYCPADALFVSSSLRPLAHKPVEAELEASGQLGSFRRAMGWQNAKPRGTDKDLSYRMFEGGIITP